MSDISVVVVSYNYGHFLSICLESLARQTRQPDHVYIMDDCSDDDTERISLDWISHQDFGCRYIRNKKNKGLVANVNAGYEMVHTQYMMGMSADDYLADTYLEKTAQILDTNPGVGVVYTYAAAFGELALERSEASSWWRRRIKLKERVEGCYPFLWEFFDYNVDQISMRGMLAKRNFIHGASLFRQSAWEAGARVRENTNGAEDWDFWKQIILAQGWGAKVVTEPLLYYRQHSNQQRNAVRK